MMMALLVSMTCCPCYQILEWNARLKWLNGLCGDLMNYHGYDYATVQIGEQCWFAENLLTEFYDNGDGILGDLSDEDWTATSDGAQAIFDDSISNLNVYGRLYNFYAVLDERSLCPAGWHVPEDSSWDTLTESLGGIDYAGLA